MHGYVQTSIGLRPVLLDRIQTVTWTYPGITISYLGQNNVVNGNIAIILNPKNDANIYGDSADVLKAFWAWVADVSSGAGPNKTLNQYLPNFTIDSVNSMNITGYSAGGAGLEALLLNATDEADACAKSWSGYARDFIVLTNSGTNYPVVGYQVWTQLVAPIKDGESQVGGVHPPDGTYAWLAPTFIANPPVGSDTSTGVVYYVTIKGGYIHAAEVCESYLLNAPSGINGHYNKFPVGTTGCPDLPTASCYANAVLNPPCDDNWVDGEFGFTGIIPPFEEFGTWNCFKSGGFFDSENLTGARVFIKDSTGKWVPFTNQEPNIPQFANQLYEEVSFEQFDVDWSNFITDPAGAPTCTYASARKQWKVNLTTGIIESDSLACGAPGGGS